ncbi:3-oxo-5-alpha-steroid 4-dehydrogenase 1 [Eucalyptus grandis]|uniref:3-oxo-5-alpha-steroid 4-dehydrogenase 1 n=1 Tax=Eucalyptus grandis TaxID=71139 RepID=UPI00192EFA6B|nr:3-oxo-5-alpha-steroid 4-dehydrogenase 1 [Eucalyptus grandis]
MAISTVLNFVYPPPPSVFTTAASVMIVASLAIVGLSEARGVHLQYSKFALAPNRKVPSRTGMLLFYSPAFLAGLASFLIFPDGDLRFLVLRSAISLHFFKRILEVLFIHKFSGRMGMNSMVVISLIYFLSTVSLIYSQHLSQGLPEPPVDLLYPGIALFLIGITGNLYHHILLSKLRKEGEGEYKIPKGGLFGWVICPHYLFEVIDFVGISFISQSVFSCSWTLATFFYLLGRSYSSRRWYTSKFEDFPGDVKALIPFIF